MSKALNGLQHQTAKTAAQRAALRLRAAQTVDRFAVQRLVDDARDFTADMVHETGQQIRAHPYTAISVLAGAGLALFHRPLGRMVDRWLDQVDRSTDQSVPTVEDGGADAVSGG